MTGGRRAGLACLVVVDLARCTATPAPMPGDLREILIEAGASDFDGPPTPL